jgi:hypothetical protein
MCCFSSRTQVSHTQIFARRTEGASQILVYQMSYQSDSPTAMILPLPVKLPAAEGSVRWKNLKEHGGFFDALAAGFPSLATENAKEPVAAAAVPRGIAVHEVGDFEASFVPSVADFDRLDPRFSIKKDVWDRIPSYKDYGFAVFQLKSNAGTPHPMAFEFDSRLSDTIYFPTVHIHDGQVHAEDQFDHLLYLQERALDAKAAAYQGPDKPDATTGLVRSDRAASTFGDLGAGVLDGNLLVHRMAIHGQHANVDTLVSASPAAASLGCTRCGVAAPASPPIGLGGGAVAALAWIIRRRDARRRG